MFLEKISRNICLYLPFLILLNGSSLFAQNQKTEILSEIAAQYRQMIPFQITFSVQPVKNETSNPVSGLFKMGKGNRFAVIFPDQEILYDGKWLWSHDRSTQQVVVEDIRPATSLQTIYDLLNGSFADFKISRITRDKKNSDLQNILLSNQSKNALFKTMTVQVNITTHTIHQVEYLDFQNNTWRIKFGMPQPLEAADSLQLKLSPQTEVIDLRQGAGKK